MSARCHRLRAWHFSAALLAVTACISCAAACAHPPQLVDGSAALRSVAARARLARELAQDIDAALGRIGTPTPADSAAVVDELAAIGKLRDPDAVNARAQRLYASSSFHQLRLANTLAVVRDALDCAASVDGPLRREMTCWAIAAANLTDSAVYEDALDVLMRSGRLGYGGGMTRARWLGLAALWARYGVAIQNYITIPYLAGALD